MSNDNLPDIDAGIDQLSQETTAADLMRQQGQRRKLRVVNQKQLKAQILEWIRMAVEGVMIDQGRLTDQEKARLIAETEARVQDLMKRNAQAEAQRAHAASEREAAEARLQALAVEHGATSELKESIAELQAQMAAMVAERDDARADMMVVEEDLDNTRRMLQATIEQKNDLNENFRAHYLRANDLVQAVLGIDHDYYADRHQGENPVDESAEDPQEAFYHDFTVAAQVVGSLADDLARLREISQQAASPQAADAATPEQPALLERDLQLLSELKEGSLAATDVAMPVAGVIEALEGLHIEVESLRSATAAAADGAEPAPLLALPEGDGEPAAVLAGAAQVVRALAAALAAERERLADLAGASAEREGANKALRENMVRTTALVQSVLELDNHCYAGRHQFDNPVSEEADAQEAFYHDFAVGAEVIGSLSKDLERLRGVVGDYEEAAHKSESGSVQQQPALLERDLALLEQLKAGSLSATDVAAPIDGLCEALNGARDEAQAMISETDAALPAAGAAPQIAVVPDPDLGEPAEVLAGLAAVVRQLQTALAFERKRLAALRVMADNADAARASGERDLDELREGLDALCSMLADRAEAAELPVGAALRESKAVPEARLQAASDLVDAMLASAGDDQAVTALAEDLSGLIDDEGARRELAAADRGEVVQILRHHIAVLGQSLDRARSRLSESESRERRLAAELRGLALALTPAMAEDEDVEVAVRRLDQALAADGEGAGLAMAELVGDLRARAEKAPVAAPATGQAVQDLARELLTAARHDASLAERAATDELASRVDDDGDLVEADRVDLEALASASRKVLAALVERRDQLASELAEIQRQQAGEAVVRAELVEALVATAREDGELAGSGAVLALADDQAPADSVAVFERARAVVAILASRRHAIAAEAEALRGERDRARDEGSDLRGELNALRENEQALRQRSAAEVAAAKEAATAAQARLTELEAELAEAHEMVLSGKEIIGHLSEKDRKLAQELEELRAAAQEHSSLGQGMRERLDRADAATRQLAESLSEAVQAMAVTGEADELEASRLELEVCLSELPDDPGVPTRPDLADDIARNGVQVIEQLRLRGQQLATALAAASESVAANAADQARIETERKEAETELQRLRGQSAQAEARVKALEQELDETSAALASKSRDLAHSREELASLGAELAGGREQVEQLQAQVAGLAQTVADYDRLSAEVERLRGASEAQAGVQRDLVEQLAAVASASGELVSEFDLAPRTETARFTRDRQKLEGEGAGERLVERSRKLVEKVKVHDGLIAEHLRGQAQQLSERGADADALRVKLSHIESGIADRDHAIANLQTELAELRNGQEQAEASRQELDAELSKQKDLLRQARAALEEYRARDAAATGGREEERVRLRAELEELRASHEQLLAQHEESRDEAEARLAALGRQRDELLAQVEERDRRIGQLQEELDGESSRRVDLRELEARNTALAEKLDITQARLSELEDLLGDHAGGSGRAGGLAEELATARRQRDEMLAEKRRLESQLAEERGVAEGLRSSRDKVRRELNDLADKARKQTSGEREERERIESQLRQIREENAGLKARLRSLTDES